MMKERFSIGVHPAGAILYGIAFLFLPSAEVLAVLAGLLWHESAHVLAMYMCGVRACRVELTPFGGMADAEAFDLLSPVRQVICAAAGLLASALGIFLSMQTRGLFAETFNNISRSLLIVNCMPVWPLDGARVVLAVARKCRVEFTIRKILTVLSWIMGLSMVCLGLYGVWIGTVNISLLLGGPYLCYAAERGKVALRLRQMQSCGKGSFLRPVDAYVCQAEMEHVAAIVLLGRREAGKCQLLYTIDDSAKIIRVRTEKELLEDIVGRET